ncbi:S-adenosyl-L-methionine-dependent methyltransferase [Kalaharituber pfeilii]|nr:S-adenosyl-L-methionine-dependent methyltransferase [Kalaharituber pfeilii]
MDEPLLFAQSVLLSQQNFVNGASASYYGNSHGPAAHLFIEPDPEDDFSLMSVDSDDSNSYVTSITPSVTDYQYENGRRYHSYRKGEYVLPNDEKEQNRLDLFHHIFRMLLNGSLFAAPVADRLRQPFSSATGRRPRVLDLGTGTGIWAIDVADEFPNTEVVANDLSPIQPSNAPFNVRFEVDDIESPWPYSLSKSFDFIHCRTLGGAISNWQALYQNAYNHLTPGGWFEVTELRMRFDSDLPGCENSTAREITYLYIRALALIGKQAEVAHLHRKWMIDAGFVNVTERLARIPSSPWPRDKKLKELGYYHMHNLIDAIDSYGIAPLTRILGMERVAAEVLLAGARAEIRNKKNHWYSVVHFVFGQKPETSTGSSTRSTSASSSTYSLNSNNPHS